MHGEYQKIPTVWKRETEKPHGLMIGTFSKPELELLKNVTWTFTEKVDGTNVRVGWDGDKVKFGGKTARAQMQITLLDRLTEIFGGEANEQVFEQTFEDATPESPVTLYGEGYGAKIQKGGGNYKPDGQDFVLFDVRIGHTWLRHDDVCNVAEKLGVRVVPIVAEGSLGCMQEIIEHGFRSAWGDEVKPEGLVARVNEGLLDRRGRRIMCKLKTKDLT